MNQIIQIIDIASSRERQEKIGKIAEVVQRVVIEYNKNIQEPRNKIVASWPAELLSKKNQLCEIEVGTSKAPRFYDGYLKVVFSPEESIEGVIRKVKRAVALTFLKDEPSK